MLVKGFISEARDLLESVVRHILELETDSANTALLNEIFRAAHTLKGSAGVVGLAAIQDVAHALEDLLEQLRSGAMAASPEIIDVLLAGFDAIQALVEALEKGENIPAPAELVARIKNLSARPAEANAPSDPFLRDLDSEGLDRLPDAARCDILRCLECDTRVYQIVVEPDPRVFFSGLDPLRAWREAMDMGTLVYFEVHTDKLPALCDLNPELCYLGFSGYLAGDINRAELEEVFIFLASETSRVRIHEITWLDLVYDYGTCPRASWEPTPVLNDFLREVTAALAELKATVAVLAEEPEAALWEKLQSLLETIKHLAKVFVGLVPRHSLPYHAATNLYVLACLLKYRLRVLPLGAEAVNLLRDTVEVLEAHVAGLREGTYPDLDMPGILDDLLRWVPSSGEDEGTLVVDQLTGTVFLDLLDQQKAYLACRGTPAELAGCALTVCRILERSAVYLGWAWLRDRVAALERGTGETEDAALTGAVTRLLEEAASRVIILDTGEDEAQDRTVRLDENQRDVKGGGVAQAAMPVTGFTAGRQEEKIFTDTIKVEQRHVDRLMDLAGELVVAKNSLPFLVREIEGAGLTSLARQLKDNYLLFDRIAKEFQDTMMDIRMLPLSYVFEKFPRFVRDTARALDKRVKLLIHGEETRLDKNVIEALNDPLLHLVRNALDHGLETEAERLEKGKQPEGVLVLRAAGERERVVIEVEDDGRGMDPDLLRAAAVERGLLGPAEAAALPDEEAFQLIFRPGFSTARAVTELSGRGVGMDVVAATVKRLKGSVQVRSRLGEGTTVRLEVPLTLALSKVLLLTSGQQQYGLPLEAVRETAKVQRRDVRTLKGREVTVWRGRLLPLVRLRDVLETDPAGFFVEDAFGTDEEHVVVLTSGFGLVVDDLIGEQDIILKPLTGELAEVRVFLGAAILGNGSILLVLDPANLVREGE